jgi:hypothetical protein
MQSRGYRLLLTPLALALLCGLATPLTRTPLAWAADAVYFEFAPDAWASHRYVVAAGATPYQVFSPRSTFLLSGYDLWIDNTGAAGPATFLLLTESGEVLATNNIDLPATAAIPGGHKRSITLTQPVTLQGGGTYSVKIISSLNGFGLYYADRINFLGHNEEFSNEYVGGVAKIGSELQPFTFKFALRSPAESTGATTGSSGDEPQVETPQEIAISNARVVGVTGSTVTLSWSSNIAADSRASVRSQLSPLYVVASSYDPTLELEHTLTVAGLIPNVNYFADVFSSNGSELVLTTYTIGFRTTSGAGDPPTTPSATTPTSPSATPSTTPSAAPGQGTTTPSSTGTGATSGEPITPPSTPSDAGGAAGSGGGGAPGGIRAESGGSSDSTEISWSAPKAGEPLNGYRVDVFDKNHTLVQQVIVPSGIHVTTIAKLEPGVHHAVVYTNTGDSFLKIGPAITFLLKSRDMNLLWKIVALVILWAGSITAYFVWKFRKEKGVLPPEEGYDPNRQ